MLIASIVQTTVINGQRKINVVGFPRFFHIARSANAGGHACGEGDTAQISEGRVQQDKHSVSNGTHLRRRMAAVVPGCDGRCNAA